jgi:hypothetical protein
MAHGTTAFAPVNRVSLYQPPLSGMNGPRDDGLCSGQPRASVPTCPFRPGQPQKMGVGAESGCWRASNRVSLYRPPLNGMNGPRDDGLCPGQPRESVPTSPFWHEWPTGRGPLPRSTTCICTNLPFLAWPAPEDGGWRRIWGLAGVQPRESVPTSPFWHEWPTGRRPLPRSTTCICTNLPFLAPKAHTTTASAPSCTPNAALFTLPVGRSRRNRGGSADHNAASGPAGVQ